MESQFDDLELWEEPSPEIEYNISPRTQSKGISLLMKLILMSRKSPEVIPKIRELCSNPDLLHQTCEKGWTPLMIACRNTKTVSTEEVVRILMDAGADINYSSSWTALICASIDSSEIVVRLLLAAGVDPNLEDEEGLTPLIAACLTDNFNISVIQLLIDAGAKINQKTKNGCTPLTGAVENNSLEGIQILLAAGADVNLEIENGYTALAYAIKHKCSLSIIQTLINAGADINLTNIHQWTPLMLACETQNLPVVNLLCSLDVEINRQNNDECSALMIACNYKEIIQTLISKGADVNLSTKMGFTPLMMAIREGNKEIVELLITAGADITSTDDNGMMALFHAAAFSTPEILKLLITAGADINSVDNQGDNCLMTSISQPDVKLENIAFLLESGIDLSHINSEGFSALMLAVGWNKKEIVSLLITAGADINFVNTNNESPLSLTESLDPESSIEMLRIFIAANVNLDQPLNGWTILMSEVKRKNLEKVKLLIAAGVNLDLQNSDGETALMVAARNFCPESIPIILALIEAGANLNLQNKDGWTFFMLLLHRAKDPFDPIIPYLDQTDLSLVNKDGWNLLAITVLCESDPIPIVKFLLRRKININSSTHGGTTPLMIASFHSTHSAELISLLLDQGADPNLLNWDAKTAFDYAIRNKIPLTIIEQMLDRGLRITTDTFIPPDMELRKLLLRYFCMDNALFHYLVNRNSELFQSALISIYNYQSRLEYQQRCRKIILTQLILHRNKIRYQPEGISQRIRNLGFQIKTGQNISQPMDEIDEDIRDYLGISDENDLKRKVEQFD